MMLKSCTYLKKTVCVFLSLALAFGMSYPQAFASDSSDHSNNEYVENEEAQEYIDITSGENGLENEPYSESFNGISNNDAVTYFEGEDPNPTPTPQPSDPEPPAGPVTFSFAIPSHPVIQDIEQVTSGLMVSWSPVSGVDGYLVLRRNEGSGLNVDDKYISGLSNSGITLDSSLFTKNALTKTGWTGRIATSSPNTVSWVDKSASYGQLYEYCVIAYKKNPYTSNTYAGLPFIPSYAQNRDLSRPSSSEAAFRMKNPTLTYVNKSAKKLTVRWTQVAGAEGYIVQCSRNSAFVSKKSKNVGGGYTLSATFTGLNKSSKYCVRVKAYGNVYSGRQYSPWTTCSYTSAIKKASMARLMYKYKVKKEDDLKAKAKKAVKGVSTKNLKASKKAKKKKVKYVTKTKPFELRVRAGQKIGKFDTMQGGCSDGIYMYLCLLNKVKKRCKIAKVSIKTKRVVKISKPMKLNHGNGLAYNPNTKKIVVVHAAGNRKAISEISKSSLKKTATHYVYAPATLAGATPAQLRAYQGFGSIAYSPENDVYVCLLSGTHNIVLLNSNFQMIKYITLSKKNGQVYQSVEVAGDSILIGESYGSTKSKRYNILTTYNWDGQYVTTTRLQKSYELENVFVAKSKVYVGFYRSYAKGKKFLKDNYVYCLNSF